MLDAMRHFIRSHRRSRPVRLGASIADKYLRAFYNEGFWDHTRNGEQFAISAFARWAGDRRCTIWDVGANHGQWARQVHAVIPHAKVTSFEIVPALAAAITAEAKDSDWWQVEPRGLSDQPGTVEVVWNHTHDSTNAIAPILYSRCFASADLERVACPVTTLDAYADETASAPDLLKIDVEGHDWAVLAGGDRLLSGDRAPAMVQFEYGATWQGSRALLGPVQQRLEEIGYDVGRLYPDHIDFRRFTFADEHFRMGNMVAVRDASLRALLGAG